MNSDLVAEQIPGYNEDTNDTTSANNSDTAESTDTTTGQTDDLETDDCYHHTHFRVYSTDDLVPLQPYPCLRGSLIISDDHLDTINLPNLRWITDDLRIEDNTILSNLAGFSALEKIGGDLKIKDNRNFNSLNGLENVSTVSKISITDNSDLVDITALSQVTAISSLEIVRNDRLENLDGLGGLVFIPDVTTISDNESLADISALHHLTPGIHMMHIFNNSALAQCMVCDLKTYLTVSPASETWFKFENNRQDACSFDCSLELDSNGCIVGEVSIENFDDESAVEPYTCIDGSLALVSSALGFISLPNLVSVSENVFIGNGSDGAPNPVRGIRRLENLKYIGGYLTVSNLTELTDLYGLNNLESVAGLRISGNAVLKSLSSLSKLTEIPVLIIENNSSLSTLGLDGLQTLPTELYISGNESLYQCEVLQFFDNLEEGNTHQFCIKDNAEIRFVNSEICENSCPESTTD